MKLAQVLRRLRRVRAVELEQGRGVGPELLVLRVQSALQQVPLLEVLVHALQLSAEGLHVVAGSALVEGSRLLVPADLGHSGDRE